MKKILFLLLLIFSFAFSNDKKYKILIGSPIHQKPNVLNEFLLSLNELDNKTYEMDFMFIDDNKNPTSTALLNAFSKRVKSNCTIIFSDKTSDYNCSEQRHIWTEDLIWKVANFKNAIIEHCVSKDYDYLFLIDSDIVLNPKTIDRLISLDKEIVSNIFWTSWEKNTTPLPQVWLSDFYTLYHHDINENLSQEEINRRTNNFLEMLKKPGTYEVGGLGACTLISKSALRKGVNFNRLKNINFWGEDRHFCIRATSLGINLFVDTLYPAYHIYRESDLEKVNEYKKENINSINPHITLSMTVKNEANRFLIPVLKNAKKYISAAVIIDDASTDNTIEVCENILKGIPVKIVKNTKSKFLNEIDLRKQQWEETIKTDPDWIMFLDADEIFEEKFSKEINSLLKDSKTDAYYFRLYDMWDVNHYREDEYWNAHYYYQPFLIRYNKNLEYKWKETPVHCGRFPKTIYEFPFELSNLRLKHLGWSSKEIRMKKYARYQEHDPLAIYGIKEQYDSILDENPNLVEWIE